MGNFDMLPETITLEILSRVPAEYVGECKSVSRPWRNLLQHPSFPRMHLNHHLSSFDSAGMLSFIFHTDRQYCYSVYDENLNSFTRTARINLRPEFKDSHILGSVNGLVCFNAYLGNFIAQPAYICNPITREYIILPNVESKKLLLCGFGYIPSTNEYKVVRVCQEGRDPNYGIIQIYTLGSGIGWRDVSKVVNFNLVAFRPQGVFVSGAIYWVDREGNIVVFNLIDEEFRKLPLPSWLPRFPLVALSVVGDFLCACDYHDEGFEYSDIWLLKKNESNDDVIWSKEFSNVNDEPINLTKSGGLLCYDVRDHNVYRYAPKASSSRMLVNFGKNLFPVAPHKNTLVSLKALGEVDTKLMDSGESAKSSGEPESSGYLPAGQKEEKRISK